MMVKGYVLNNTGKTKHVYKRTVYPGQKVDLSYIYKQVKKRAPSEGKLFVSWLKENLLPEGWEVILERPLESPPGPPNKKEALTASITVTDGPVNLDSFYKEKAVPEKERPSLEFATPKRIRELTAQEIFDLKLKDNPERIIGEVTSVHKLRRALSMCKNNSRKSVLTRIIRRRIKQLNATL